MGGEVGCRLYKILGVSSHIQVGGIYESSSKQFPKDGILVLSTQTYHSGEPGLVLTGYLGGQLITQNHSNVRFTLNGNTVTNTDTTKIKYIWFYR